MSSGHIHTAFKDIRASRAELARCLRLSDVKKRLYDTKFSLNRDYDIPYLAGYSKDGRIVYIDRHLPTSLRIGGRLVHIFPFLIVHERTEKALLDFAGMRYNEAHELATLAEHKELDRHGVSASLYEKALDPYIKADQHEKIQRIPANLDFRPYKDSNYNKLIQRMNERIAA